MVEHKPTKALYAVKYVNKAKCMRSRAVQHILQERRLLEKVCGMPPKMLITRLMPP